VVFYGIVIVAARGFGAWFVRTPLFRAHVHRGKDPGQRGAHGNASGSMLNANNSFRKND
jgi:hypothetical protein